MSTQKELESIMPGRVYLFQYWKSHLRREGKADDKGTRAVNMASSIARPLGARMKRNEKRRLDEFAYTRGYGLVRITLVERKENVDPRVNSKTSKRAICFGGSEGAMERVNFDEGVNGR